jgi:hypothetical protein
VIASVFIYQVEDRFVDPNVKSSISTPYTILGRVIPAVHPHAPAHAQILLFFNINEKGVVDINTRILSKAKKHRSKAPAGLVFVCPGACCVVVSNTYISSPLNVTTVLEKDPGVVGIGKTAFGPYGRASVYTLYELPNLSTEL